MASPVSLNMVVSTLLLQAPQNEVSLKGLISSVRKVWYYLRSLFINSFMTLEPTADSVETCVGKLNFTMKEVQINKGAKKA